VLHVHHVSRSAPATRHTLAEFHFGANAAREITDPRQVPVTLAQLGGDERIERWSTDAPVTVGRHDGFDFAHDGSCLFASVVIPPERSRDLEKATRSAYMHLDALIRRQGYPYWLRAWNHFSGITTGEGESERYRQFNSGRHTAVSLSSGIDNQFPAASALGSDAGGFVLCCLAGREPGIHIENPRQVSAVQYPPQYGRRSPMFARATLVPKTVGRQLLVSGTASIVGHESRHLGDPVRQLEETAQNLEALLENALRTPGVAAHASRTRLETLRVYVRNPADYEELMPTIRRLFAADAPPLVLRADVCRRELIVEVEGTYALG
jgi:chorismate lyase/3-hydroxybenzoate synthase